MEGQLQVQVERCCRQQEQLLPTHDNDNNNNNTVTLCLRYTVTECRLGLTVRQRAAFIYIPLPSSLLLICQEASTHFAIPQRIEG